ncbi:quinolinate synthase NadA [Clostridium tarantellae]|uniref:Quinolinate synthase n=1 Tax=Clostridium tarantellae TaxID=39493 RepID=A0A6I1MIS7_9CLOT|nr:quinolinate synthase NadA [Clostridium tarantellae]MPQ42593.1 quinolinate synthase NadA [Clostridium tarantellae]
MFKGELIERIKILKEEKGILILAHYYVDGIIQELADFVGDSYYLSKIAKDRKENIILFCGVSFMGESAKILSPHKKVIVPTLDAKCPMAFMVNEEKVNEIKTNYDDLAVVCYINSTAEIKGFSDVCVTSSNAYNIVKNLKEKNIYFIPDNNLGRYLATKLPNKNFIFNEGYCPIHQNLKKDDILKVKEVHKNAEILVHPECKLEVLELASFIGSTSGIIDYATKSEGDEFIICTEMGILHELITKNPFKKFHSVIPEQICPDMKKITLEAVYNALNTLTPEILLEKHIEMKAVKSLEKMHELGR